MTKIFRSRRSKFNGEMVSSHFRIQQSNKKKKNLFQIVNSAVPFSNQNLRITNQCSIIDIQIQKKNK